MALRTLLSFVLFIFILLDGVATGWATPTRVTITPDGVLQVNGAKVFPIALTMAPAADAKSPDGRNALLALHSEGINFIRSGPTQGQHWDEAAIDAEIRYEDAAARAGLYCMPFLRDLGSIGPKNAAREQTLRKLIARLKDNPGLGVWKGADEPEWGKLPVESLVRVKQVLHELDSDHPVWIVQAPRGTIETLRPYDPTYDILGCDIYPISYPPGIHSLGNNKQMSMVGDYTREMVEIAGPKPVWMTLQIAWSGVVKPGKTLRMPTFPEERFMTYEAIIDGARGLVYFGGNLHQAWAPRDVELGWNWSFWQKVLGPVIAEIGPKAPLAAALVAPKSKLNVGVNKPEEIEFTVREVGNEVYLLACKRSGETAQVTFTGLPGAASEGEVLFEAPREVSAKDGRFSDWFAPFEVHVYRFQLH